MTLPSPPSIDKVLDLLVDAVCIVDAEGRFLFVSAAFEQIFGYAPEEVIGRHMRDLVHPDDQRRTLEATRRIMNGEPQKHFENRYIRKDGRVVDIMWSARWSETERVRIAVARDISAIKRGQRRQSAIYRISEASHTAADLPSLYAQIHRIISELLPAANFRVAHYESMSDTLSFPYFVDEHKECPEPAPLRADSNLAQVILSGQALLAHTAGSDPGADGALPNWLGAPLTSPNGVIGALVVQCPAGCDGPVRGYTEEDRELLQFVSGQVANAIVRKQAENRLRHMAGHDALTDLPNRILFHDRLDIALSRARREGERLALLYLDLNGFKQVNDRCGHDIGDQLLQDVALKLSDTLRDSDTIARIGGDEFTVLLSNINSIASVDHVCRKIHQAIEQPIEIGGHVLHVSTSIGAALYPEHGDTREQLMKHADRAMYEMKQNGG